MERFNDRTGRSGLLKPENVAEQLPSRPVLSSSTSERQGLVLQRYHHPPSTIDVPGLRDVLLVAHLAGPVLVEEARQEGRIERRWTGPGQITLTPTGQPIRRVLKGRPDVALLYFPSDLLHALAQEVYGLGAGELSLLSRLGFPDETAERLVWLLLREAERPGSGTMLMMESLTRALGIHLLRFHSNLAPLPPDPTPSLPEPRLKRVIEQMRSDLGEHLPLSRLAETSGLSPSQFVRAFRSATGQPPHRYLVGLRVEHARALLEKTEIPVTLVGLRCGFTQPSHFASSFRALTGFSPRAWRQARRT